MRIAMLVAMVVAILVAMIPSTSRAAPELTRVTELADRVIEALAAADPRHTKVGVTTAIGEVHGSADLDAARASLTDAFDAAGLDTIDAGITGGSLHITVEDKRGARATIALDQYHGSASVTARPARAKLPGSCVAPPATAPRGVMHHSKIDVRGVPREGDVVWELAPVRLADVDGDGVLDTFVPIISEGSCRDDRMHDVYVMRGTCGHLVGRVGPGDLTSVSTAGVGRSTFRRLVFDQTMTVPGKRHIPDSITTTSTFELRGTAYRRVSSTSRRGACHHCALSQCF